MILRPVGNLERFSTARHHLGFYRCVASTAKYSTSAPPENLSTAIENALAKVILQHPALCSGIINEDKKDPAFVLLESIDVSNRFELRNVNGSTPAEHEAALEEILEERHRELWPDIESLPPWKVIIVQSSLPSSQNLEFDAIFAFHHSLGDGISGLVFHNTFQEALNNPDSSLSLDNHILKIPGPTKLLPAVENLVDLKISWLYLLKQVWDELRPKWLFPDASLPWTGNPCSAETAANYRSRVKIFSISPDLVPALLAACREQKATLTGLMHALILVSLSSHVPEAESFTSTTPYSMRHLSGISPTKDIAVHVSAHSLNYKPDVISSIRSATTPEHLTSQIWAIARDFRTSIAAQLATLPNDNPLGMIPYISDMHGMFKSKLGKPRSDTYEISNVGVLKNEEGGKWKIERAVFSQSGMPTGAPFAVNVASVGGGPLGISVTWLEGDIEQKVIEGVVKDLQYGLKCVGEGKDVHLGL